MQSDLVLHPKTANYLKSLHVNPRQAILFTGPKGMGKKSIATHLVALFKPKRENVLIVDSGVNASIGIEEVRKIKQFLKLKSNHKDVQRFIQICDSEIMTEEAQNSLLKMLEEPPHNTYFVLTSSRPNQLLATILSRVESHEVVKPSRAELVAYLMSLLPGEDTAKIIALSAGLPGIAVSIARKESNVFLEDIQAAKLFIGSPVADRFRVIDGYAKDRIRAQDFLGACLTVCRAAMDAHIDSQITLNQWANKASQVLSSIQLLEKNVSTKLVLTELAVTL